MQQLVATDMTPLWLLTEIFQYLACLYTVTFIQCNVAGTAQKIGIWARLFFYCTTIKIRPRSSFFGSWLTVTTLYQTWWILLILLVLFTLYIIWEMLTSVPGALVKESNVDSLALELVLSTHRKFKKCYFYFEISSFSFLNQCPGALVNKTHIIYISYLCFFFKQT